MARREEAARGLGRPRRPGARGFLAAEDGTLAVFGLFILLAMLMAAGLAVDTMRHERERVRMQATLDRAVLAAADLEQRLDPEEVVRDYFEAAGILGALGAVSVDSGLNARAVTADASLDLDTIFLDMVGVDTLRAAVAARAEESVTDVEISLVLDVSSSMFDFSRGENMERAALEFVETVMPRAAAPGDQGIVSLSLVPYSMTVTLPPALMAQYNVTEPHNRSRCVLFADEDFTSTALPPERPLRQYPHFDNEDGDWRRGQYEATIPRRTVLPLCPHAAPAGAPETNALVPLSTNPERIKQAIRDFVFWDATGIDAGMRWGIAMLDPATRPVIARLAETDADLAASAGRPLDYGAPDALKVAVLMTDGDPDGQRDLHETLRSGASNVYQDKDTGRYSVLLRGSVLRGYAYSKTPIGTPDLDCGHRMSDAEIAALPADEPRGIERVAVGRHDDRCAPRWYWPTENIVTHRPYTAHRDTPQRNDWSVIGPGLQRLSNQEVLHRFTARDARRTLYEQPNSRGWFSSAEWAIFYEPTVFTDTAQGAVDRLLDLCAAAREPLPGTDQPRITVFTIGFEMDRIRGMSERDLARRLMRDCATDPSHYFDVNALQIGEAFHLIASQIDKLRLTR